MICSTNGDNEKSKFWASLTKEKEACVEWMHKQ
jgi:hypothetical protein